mmetsp:Transcript_84723/g.244919  ORF Transcript_84723/g.244919 Transcript_84723/m.244919 type:complete len:173 (+) Transcript_84723:70-588(+)
MSSWKLPGSAAAAEDLDEDAAWEGVFVNVPTRSSARPSFVPKLDMSKAKSLKSRPRPCGGYVKSSPFLMGQCLNAPRTQEDVETTAGDSDTGLSKSEQVRFSAASTGRTTPASGGQAAPWNWRTCQGICEEKVDDTVARIESFPTGYSPAEDDYVKDTLAKQRTTTRSCTFF